MYRSRCAGKYRTLLCFVFAIAADPKLLLTKVEAKQWNSVLQRNAQEWGPRDRMNKQLSASSSFINHALIQKKKGSGGWFAVPILRRKC